MGSGLKADTRDDTSQGQHFNIRVSRVKSPIGGIVVKWRLTVQCFLCHISISPRLSLLQSVLIVLIKKNILSHIRLSFFFLNTVETKKRNYTGNI